MNFLNDFSKFNLKITYMSNNVYKPFLLNFEANNYLDYAQCIKYEYTKSVTEFFNKDANIKFDRQNLGGWNFNYYMELQKLIKANKSAFENLLSNILYEYYQSEEFEVLKAKAKKNVINIISKQLGDYQISLKELSAELLLE